MPGMVELGEDIFLKPVRRGIPKYSRRAVGHGGAAACRHRHGPARRGARWRALRGFKVAQKNGSVKTAFGRFKDFIVGNF